MNTAAARYRSNWRLLQSLVTDNRSIDNNLSNIEDSDLASPSQSGPNLGNSRRVVAWIWSRQNKAPRAGQPDTLDFWVKEGDLQHQIPGPSHAEPYGNRATG